LIAVTDPEPVVITPPGPGVGDRVREAWANRRVTRFFARRFNQKRYTRTWLGRSWLVLRPLLVVASQAFVFGGVIGIASGERPYLVAFLVAFSTWHLFAEASYWATRSLELNRGVLRRLYVPRLTIIVGAVWPGMVDFLIIGAMLVVALGYFALVDGQLYLEFGPALALLPLALTALVAFGLGIGLWLAVPGAQARDVRFGLRFLLSFWYFLTPVIYPLASVPDGYRTVIEANPLTAPIQLVKMAAFGHAELPTLSICTSTAVLAFLLIGGVWVFLRAEASALDHV
jgi:lipopolysaccharide transport system permease protein